MNFGSNLSFTLYDIASHVIPGSSAFLVIYNLKTFPELSAIKFDTLAIVIFGYVIGHLFHAIGSLLTIAFYKEDYKNKPILMAAISLIDRIVKFIPPNEKATSPDIKADLWQSISKKYNYNPKEKSALKLFQIADVIVSKDKYEERNILLAREGFYRSLIGFTTFLLIYLIINFPMHTALFLAMGAVILKILFYQHEHTRRIKNNQIYLYSLLKLKE